MDTNEKIREKLQELTVKAQRTAKAGYFHAADGIYAAVNEISALLPEPTTAKVETPTDQDLLQAGNLHRRDRDTHGSAKPTKQELEAAVKVFSYLTRVGSILNEDILRVWASQQHSRWDNILFFVKTTQK